VTTFVQCRPPDPQLARNATSASASLSSRTTISRRPASLAWWTAMAVHRWAC